VICRLALKYRKLPPKDMEPRSLSARQVCVVKYLIDMTKLVD